MNGELRRADALPAARGRARLDGPAPAAGRSRPGEYELAVAAEDTAGNVGERTPPTTVRIRYVELGAGRRSALARGTRFGVRVRTDARSVRWRFAGATGTARRGVLVLRAPRQPGRYRLFVEANGHARRARSSSSPR